jgi:flagellar biosynthesis protein FliR
MPLDAPDILLILPPFLMVLFRIAGLAVAAPLFSSTGVPGRVKIGFSLVLSAMLFPVLFPLVPRTMTLGEVIPGVFGELMIGLVLGSSVGMIFLGARLTGMVVGQQAGIALGQVINPMMDGQSTVIGQMYYLILFMIFLAVGGHRATVRAMLDTFAVIPPGSFRFDGSYLILMTSLLQGAYTMTIRLAAPALIALFMASLTMGFLSRTMPQLNVLTVGFSVRIFVGLSVAAISLSHSFELFDDVISRVLASVRDAFGLWPV